MYNGPCLSPYNARLPNGQMLNCWLSEKNNSSVFRLRLLFPNLALQFIHMILYSGKNILLHIVCYSAFFFKNLRICSAKFGNSKSVWAHVTD